MAWGQTQEDISQKRDRLMKRMCILNGITLIVSVVSIIIGIVQITESGGKFPYNAGGAIIGGIMSLFLTICPCAMYVEGKKSHDTTGCFDCCAITMAIWWSLTILAIPIGLGISGAYGLVECMNPPEDGVCFSNEDSKLVLSVLTILVSFVLIVLTMGIFFTCCCNAKTFGQDLLIEPSVRYIPNYRQEEFMRSGPGPYQSGGRFASRSPIGSRRANNDYFEDNGMQGLSVNLPPLDNSDNEQGLSVRLPPLDHRNREPSAPSPHSNNRRDMDRENRDTGRDPTDIGRSRETRDPPGYTDPPPSYDEVVKQPSIDTSLGTLV